MCAQTRQQSLPLRFHRCTGHRPRVPLGQGAQSLHDQLQPGRARRAGGRRPAGVHRARQPDRQAGQGVLLLLPQRLCSSCSPALAVQLNVYAEGDFFKAHIDTPHGTDMLGSLVVCLPCAHTGGALLVKHLGQEVRSLVLRVQVKCSLSCVIRCSTRPGPVLRPACVTSLLAD